MRQAGFARSLLDPELAVPQGLTDPKGRTDQRRFSVYRNNVAFGLSGALANYFPVTRDLVGPDFFGAMATAFLRRHPPKSPVLIAYGDAFPGFIAGFAPADPVPYLADVARLELALRDAYHAADAVALSAADLAATGADDLMACGLTFAPAVRLVRSDWPIASIWAAHRRNADPPRARQGEDVLVLRPGFDPEPHALPPGSAPVIAALLAGRTLGAALELAGPGTDLPAALALLFGQGAITRLTRSHPE